ncbi:MAG: membrane dipeptidase [Anaerolineae bacterium]
MNNNGQKGVRQYLLFVVVSALMILFSNLILPEHGFAQSCGAEGQAPCTVSPAIFRGRKPSQCPANQRFDLIDGGTCWSCPSGYEHTVFPVDGAAACERPASTDYRSASRHGRGTGLIGTDCPSGQFWDPNGYCYSCPSGYSRTGEPVTGSKACSRPVPASYARATLQASLSCPSGSDFYPLVDGGTCWNCPSGFSRTLSSVKADDACAAAPFAGIGTEFGVCDPGLINIRGVCLPRGKCGGENQRPCLLDERTPSCNPGLVEDFNTNRCVRPTPPPKPQCGAEGQRPCLITERFPSCDPGLEEDLNTNRCVRPAPIGPIDEPSTNWTPPSSSPPPLRGYADLHLHIFAHLAHGGGVLAGKPYDPSGGINVALQPDDWTDVDLVKKDGGELPRDSDGRVLFHGDHVRLDLMGLGIDDPVGVGTGDETNSKYGVPAFSGWPKWSSTTHQQVYYRWLERAWRGGLRLVTMLAVTNEALCKGNKRLRGTDCEKPMVSIDAQLDEAFKFQQFIDDESGGPGQGWFRIVTTPEEARQVIREGKLAVVLGIEVDNLFNCKFGECDETYVRDQVDLYYDKGVRHIFPVHNFDNAFGGAAAWQDAINVGNRVSEGHWWNAEECSNLGYGFKLDWFISGLINILGFGDQGGLENPPPYDETATCNQLGLSRLGEVLVNKLMAKGMIIDIDHMSNKSLDRTLALAEVRSYPGLVASHVVLFDLHDQSIRHERMRTKEQLERIRELGGMIALMLKDDVLDTDKRGQQVTSSFGTKVANDCRHSSKMWAQMYQYVVDLMGEGSRIAFGSDFNGIAGHLGPRFGAEACGKNPQEQAAQKQRLDYPFTLEGFGTFDEQVTGLRTFNYNEDGLAHVGLLPDLIADLKVIGLSEQDLDPLWGSAEAYIKMWEQAFVGVSGFDDEGSSGRNIIAGRVIVPGRTNAQGVRIEIDNTPAGLTEQDGSFEISTAMPGRYMVRAFIGGYLPAEKPDALVMPGETTTLSPVQLVSGDVDGDEEVALWDLVIVAGNYRTNPPDDPRADINGDGQVDLLDLVLVAGSYHRAGAISWP